MLLVVMPAKAVSFKSNSSYAVGEVGKVISVSVCTKYKDNSFRRKTNTLQKRRTKTGQGSLHFCFAIPDKEQVVQNIPFYAFSF